MLISHPQLAIFSLNGMSDMLAILLTTFSFFLILGPKPANPWLAGFVFGLLNMTNFSSVIYLPIFGIGLWLRDRRSKPILQFLVCFAVTCLPWALRTHAVTGNPFFSANMFNWAVGTDLSSDSSIFIKVAPVHLADLLRDHFPSFMRKVFWNIDFYVKSYFFAYPLLAISSLILLVRCRNPRLCLVLASVAFSALVFSTGNFGEDRYLFPLYPVLAIVCVQQLSETLKLHRLIAYLIIVTSIGWNVWIAEHNKFARYQARNPSFLTQIAEVKRLTQPNDVIISDIAPAMAWYGNRRSIWTPYDLSTLEHVQNVLPSQAFHLFKSGADIPRKNYPTRESNSYLRSMFPHATQLFGGGILLTN